MTFQCLISVKPWVVVLLSAGLELPLCLNSSSYSLCVTEPGSSLFSPPLPLPSTNGTSAHLLSHHSGPVSFKQTKQNA